MDKRELFSVLESIRRERGIPQESLLEGIKEALYFAYKKKYGRPPRDLWMVLDEDKGEFKVFVKKLVVDRVRNKAVEISLEEAKNINSEIKVGEEVELESP